MKSNFIPTLLVVMMSCFPSGLSMRGEVTTRTLDTDWRFRQARQGSWHPAVVPGEVHTDLMREGIIEDPFIGQNERKVQWVDKEDWIYETSFRPAPELLRQKNVDLVFKGLDTYADVYLNDSLLLKADNMFREWRIPVKDILRDSDNSLRVYFHSPIKTDMPKFDALDFNYEACNDQSENGGILDKRVSIFARKAGYHYGWDWGPRLVTSGIWRPVELEGWTGVKIDDIFVQTRKISPRKAEMGATLSVMNDDGPVKCRLEVTDTKSGKRLASKEYLLKEGSNELDLTFGIGNPKLWWCNGLGEPYLYDLRFDLVSGKETLAGKNVSAGVRTLEVVRENDKDGTSFYFKLNGVPVFAKGANYIPCDNFLSRVTEEIYEKTIRDAVDVNMNMLRVWGGGIYEDDLFYDLCDRNGIMVWQDFMFACSMYPAEGEMMDNIRQEAVDNVRRLRNHPSIAIWCGNNECLEAWYGWGWRRRYVEQGVDSIIWRQYDDLFHKTLPEVVEEHAPGSFYWPSSPFSRYDGVAEADKGDFHLWTVWGQSRPIDEYNHSRSRFFSEYGFQSFPSMETIKRFAPDRKDWDINSEVMMSHQRGGEDANNRIRKYLSDSYPEPKDFESLVYMTQILQGDAIRTAIESHRRNKPYCMGSLFWQHNDCWPVASWSSRDYFGNWKAQHYYARKAFDDIMVSCVDDNGALDVYVVSDRQTGIEGNLVCNILTLDGDTIAGDRRRITVEPDGVAKVSLDLDGRIGTRRRDDLIVSAQFTDRDGKTYETVKGLLDPKEMAYSSPDIRYSVKEDGEGKVIELESDTYVKGLYLSVPDVECVFSDNYFDLLPNRPVSVRVKTQCDADRLGRELSLTHIYSATHP